MASPITGRVTKILCHGWRSNGTRFSSPFVEGKLTTTYFTDVFDKPFKKMSSIFENLGKKFQKVWNKKASNKHT
jgi:hypothetical protein